MDNKLVSLLIKVGMGILLFIGIILIWNNLSYDTSGDEPLANQEFFRETYKLPAEDGKKPVEESITHYDYVIDTESSKIYNLSNSEIYDQASFDLSKGAGNSSTGSFKTEDVDPVLMNQYNLQNATSSSVSYTYWLMIGGLILIALFTVFNIIQNPKRFIPSAIGTAILAIIAFICYSMVEPAAAAGSKVMELDTYTDSSYQWTGMGIALFIALAGIAFLLIIWGFVKGMLGYFSK